MMRRLVRIKDAAALMEHVSLVPCQTAGRHRSGNASRERFGGHRREQHLASRAKAPHRQRHPPQAPAEVTLNLGNGITATVSAAPHTAAAPAPSPHVPPQTPNAKETVATPAPTPAITTPPSTSLADTAAAVQRDLVVHRLTTSSRAELSVTRGCPISPPAFAEQTVPLLLTAAEALAPHAKGEDAAVTMATLQPYTAAQQDLARYLTWLEETATRTTGRRYEAAFPAALVSLLWHRAMPALRHAIEHIPPRTLRKDGHDAETSLNAPSTPGEDGKESAVLVTTAATERQAIKAFQRAYKEARRALALRTRTLADVLVRDSPDGLVLTLARMQHCGALSDDVLSPVAAELLHAVESAARDSTGGAPQQVARNHTLTAHDITPALPNTSSSAEAPGAVAAPSLSPAAAMTLARLLGRQQAPGHFHLHKLMHTVLLPALQTELAASAAALSQASEGAERAPGDLVVPPRAALEDLTRCFVHYAVSGSAVEHLAALWQPHLRGHAGSCPPATAAAMRAERFTVGDCAQLLRVLSQPPASALQPSDRQQGARRRGATATALTDLYAHVSRRRQARRDSLVAADEYAPLIEMLCDAVGTTCRQFLEHHAGTEKAALAFEPNSQLEPSPAAEELQDITPDAMLKWMLALVRVNSPRWAEVYTLSATTTLVSLSQLAGRQGNPADALPLALVEQFVYELLNRNTYIPDHPLHRVLLKRLLHAPETLQDAKMASTAVLALELMAPLSAATEETPQREGVTAQTEAAGTEHEETALVQTALQESGDALAIGSQDRAAAFELLKRHDGALGLTAFVAAMCASPLQDLSVKEQGRLLNHFTSIASALHPSWLARGIVAATRKLDPRIVGEDGVAVHKWFSRFTARDVVRKLDLAPCADLLTVLATRDHYLADNAIALHSLVRHVGTLLKSEKKQDEALEVLPALVPALRQARVFYAPLFSRICRLMLAEVAQAPWELLLPAFAVTADEFMGRSRQEASGTVFRDVWELLRQRVMADAAESLTLPDVLAALNGFAALDGGDRPLFLVLTRRLWATVSEALAEAVHSEEGDIASVSVESERPDDRLQHVRANIGSYLCGELTPSAVAVLTSTLLFKQSGPDVACMLPWVLVALASPSPTGAPAAARELYPIDVVQLMPALLNALTDAALGASDETAAAATAAADKARDAELLQGLLHRAYDACREQFLLMYQVVRDATAAADTAVVRQREEWSPKVLASVDLVPKRFFAFILVGLSASGLRDAAVATACATKCCTARCCQELLSVQTLVDVCMSLCMQFPPSQPDAETNQQETASGTGLSGNDADAAPPHIKFMPPVLNALWRRTDELDADQVDALLRCLRHYYGESVDKDFVHRLHAQKQLLQERQTKLQDTSTRRDPVKDKASASVDATPLSKRTSSAEMPAGGAASFPGSQSSAPPPPLSPSPPPSLLENLDDSMAELMMESLGEEL